MGVAEDKLPTIAMVLLQCIYAIMALLNRAALVKGMSPRVFIFYRQAIATLVITPIAYFTREKSSNKSSMGIRSFVLIFVTAFIGVVLNQTTYFEGLYMASSSIASAMSNLVPAVTFLIAVIMGLEHVNLKKLSSMAKILGTVFCVGGAVPMTASCPNHLSLSAWMCFLSTLQAGAIALYSERDPRAWDLSSNLELTCCFFSGILGSGIQFIVQSWCISRRGPLFSAMFNPLCTVITTVMACIFLHEQLYLGSLLGGAIVIVGLYIVLWGKAKEMKGTLEPEIEDNTAEKADLEKLDSKHDLEQPLLAEEYLDYTDKV